MKSKLSLYTNRTIVALFVLFLVSCSKDNTDILTNTVWSNADTQIIFSSEKQLTFSTNNVIKWVGVYVLYENNSILLYKTVAGETNNYVLTYVGIINNEIMELSNDTSVIVLNKQ